jgi:hypothetical protein
MGKDIAAKPLEVLFGLVEVYPIAQGDVFQGADSRRPGSETVSPGPALPCRV